MNLIFFLFLLLNSCISINNDSTGILSIVDEHVKEMSRKEKLELFGVGNPIAPDIEHIFLRFETQRIVNICQARKIYVECMERLLNKINSNIHVRPYLHNFPFNFENIELKISFENPKSEVEYMMIANGILYYAYDDKNTNQYETLYSEPYEEAVRIVRESN